MMLRWVAVVVFMAIAAKADNVEVNAQGEQAAQACDCEAELRGHLVAAEGQCSTRVASLETQQRDAVAGLEQRIAQGEKEKNDFVGSLTKELQASETQKNELMTALQSKITSLEQALQKTTEDLNSSNVSASSLGPLQQTLDETTKLLSESKETIAALQKDHETKLAESKEENMQLRRHMIDGAEKQASVESEARKCHGVLETTKENQETMKEETDRHLQMLRTEITQLTSHKNKRVELDQIVKQLQEDVDNHKSELHKTRDNLSKELETHKTKALDAHEKMSHSARELSVANKRMKELDDNASSTYVNTTLIQRDMATGAIRAAEESVRLVSEASNVVSPHWGKAKQLLGPVLVLAGANYKEHAAPLVKQAQDEATKLYDEHAKEHVDKHALPALEPIFEFLSEAFAAVSVVLKHTSKSMYHFLDHIDLDGVVHTWLVATLKWTSENSDEALNRTLKFFLYLTLFRVFIWRGKKKKPVNEDVVEDDDVEQNGNQTNGVAKKQRKRHQKNGHHKKHH